MSLACFVGILLEMIAKKIEIRYFYDENVALVSISCSFHHFDSNLVFTYKSQ
jgi:hypothetical protein